MPIYAISDLHLSFSANKPMDVFGGNWSDYVNKLSTNWSENVKDTDTVILPGDISWATYLEEAVQDFRFIEKLPGKKIILKGNHDYWWSTANKLDNFLKENDLFSIKFLHNNSYMLENFVLCGTRGWKCPGDDNFTEDDCKIYDRELRRLELSLSSASQFENKNIIVAMHFPPFNARKEFSEFIKIMKEYQVKTCLYGHLHGSGIRNSLSGNFEGIDFKLISADLIDFNPVRINF